MNIEKRIKEIKEFHKGKVIHDFELENLTMQQLYEQAGLEQEVCILIYPPFTICNYKLMENQIGFLIGRTRFSNGERAVYHLQKDAVKNNE